MPAEVDILPPSNALISNPTFDSKQSVSVPLEKIMKYIKEGWHTLSRSMKNERDIQRAFGDTKINSAPILYFPFGFPFPSSLEKTSIELRHLPRKIERIGDFNPDTGLSHHGLLYLPNPYVVPGGMFNEMYGWDSYFIIRGLIEDGSPEMLNLALGMIENFFFQIEHYGGILNANRTYYLSRSQPPFLSSMVLALLKEYRKKDDGPTILLEERLSKNGLWFVEKELRECWLQPHRIYTPQSDCITGSLACDFIPTVPSASTPTYSSITTTTIASLSRFHGGEDTPVVEMGHDSHYFESVAKKSRVIESGYLKESSLEKPIEKLSSRDLSGDFFLGDRAMRESGFDVSFRFGPFSGATHHYLPVCLNSLLYKAEMDLAELSKDEHLKLYWKKRAAARSELMNRLLWDEEQGLYFDYNTSKQERSNYSYLSTFYPLWVGQATPEQAKQVASHLDLFEQPGGLACSPKETGAQWDLPYGWAPLHLIAIEGLRNYGFRAEANRLSVKFLSTVLSSFLKDNTIREKYDVRTCSAESHITIGYKENVVGFGWTNGVFLALSNALDENFIRKFF